MKNEAFEGEKKTHYYNSPLNEGKPTQHDGKTIQGNEWWSRLNSNC